jgi:peptide/nickel transport system permease protein
MSGDRAPSLRLRQTLRSGRVLVGGGIVLVIALCALFAPLLAPHDPGDQDLLANLLPPAFIDGGNADHLLGTDSLGRDILSRLIYGSRVAMFVAVFAAFFAMLLGGTMALLAGYFGGRIDWLISRTVDAWMSFPPVILSVILMVGLGVGLINVVLAIVLVDWTRFCRVMRAEVLVVARRDYIAAARLVGFTDRQVILREVLPAVIPLMITLLSLEMGIAVIVEAILSFVGLSVEANVPAWGVMIADARNYMYQSTWSLILPVLAIFITVLGFNLLGDGLRRTLDPRLLQDKRVDA